MDSRLSVHAHIQALRLRMRDTVWVLRHLKIVGTHRTGAGSGPMDSHPPRVGLLRC